MAYTTIDDPSAYFQTALYTGNGGTQSITNDGNSDLQPDLVYMKERNGTNWCTMYDSSRGVTKQISTNVNNYEYTSSGLTAFNSDGFTLGSATNENTNTNTYVGWQWKANGGTRTTNTESGDNPGGGYQANTTAGFSIVDYTGTGATGTMAHGLGAVPHVMIFKNRADARDWRFYHKAYGAEKYLDFNTSTALGDASTPWNDTDPTSSVFTVGSDGGSNDDGDGIIAYLWTGIQGYSKFGSYEGNGNSDGAFVYTGFKPAWVLVRRTETGNNWHLVDNKRDTFNPTDLQLYPNLSNAEYAEDDGMDFLSNGFKIRESANWINEQELYIYMAFAEQPFVTSGGVPCTAE